MTRGLLCIAGACIGLSMTAQTLHIGNGGVTYSYTAEEAGKMAFGTNPSENVCIQGLTHRIDGNTRIKVDNEEVEKNTVTVSYADGKAEVDIAGNIATYISATVDGAHVYVTQSEEVGEGTCGEITYRLGGESGNGSFNLEGSFKSTLELRGLHLTNPAGAALNIDNGKRIALSVKSGTTNTLADGTGGSHKGCIVCKGHLELKGKGALTVTGNTSHAIYAKEYVELKNCTVTVDGAVKDGVNCNQYFLMESGSLNITGTGDDGIQVAFKDDADRDEEDTGAVTISGGKIDIAVTADAAKGIKCEGPMNISGGEIAVSVTGNGVWDSGKNKTKASACLGADGDMTIEGGTLRLSATGAGGKGISADGTVTINGGETTISTSGGITAYVNGVLHTNYTGNTDRLASDQKSSPKGIKADTGIVINDGRIDITTTGNGGEGIESKALLTINGGDITVTASDDAINSSGHMYINGGNITVISTGNDGLDSNGNLYIAGGYIMAFGSRSPECGLDANEEEGYTVVFSGGTLLAAGGSNSVPSTSSGSSQAYISASATVSANSTVALTNSAGETLATFTVPSNYTQTGNPGFGGGRPGGGGFGGGSSLLVTCGGLSAGTSYTLTAGTSNYNVTARLTGSSTGGPR